MKRKLWNYQVECLQRCVGLPIDSRGQVILPTGTGKTVIAMAIAEELMFHQAGFVTTIFAPRLMLLAQWAREIAQYLSWTSGIPIALVCVHSGNVSKKARTILAESNKLMQLEGRKKGLGPAPIPEATTKPDEVAKAVREAVEQGYHVLVLCTYHSARILNTSGVECDLAICDEAHYLVPRAGKDTKYREALGVPADRMLFFTATPVTTDDNETEDAFGMQNEAIFGEVIFSRSPKEMIELGAIVGPLIHQVIVDKAALEAAEKEVDGEIVKEHDYESQMWLIYRAWQKHREVVKKRSANHDKLGAKMLVVCKDQPQLIAMFKTEAMQKMIAEQPELALFGLSTEFGVYIDGEHHRPPRKGIPLSSKYKEDLLDELQFNEEENTGLRPEEDAIIFHVNMIGEGLDVPGITGVLFLRNCDLILFLQNLGRACRLHIEDKRKVWQSGEGAASKRDRTSFIKPNCYVILPWCIEWNGSDFLHRFENIVEGLRSFYSIEDITTNVITDFVSGEVEELIAPEEQIKVKTTAKANLKKIITDYCHKVEREKKQDEANGIKSQVVGLDSDQREAFALAIAGKDPSIPNKGQN